uniref:U77-Liphistoxin-Lsp1a_1 n=1 Tax=Liphistius sp. SGP-2016 TaxID=1905180 RepID=A0A4Q8K2D6_9ARAC
MKRIIFSVLLLGTVIAVTSYPFKSCSKSTDCGVGACCTAAPLKMKTCEPIGNEGDFCITEDHQRYYGGLYFLRCPCTEGLQCVAVDGPFPGGKGSFLNAKCRKVSTSAANVPVDI